MIWYGPRRSSGLGPVAGHRALPSGHPAPAPRPRQPTGPKQALPSRAATAVALVPQQETPH
eukprot:5639811-Lingulodinium_polyedra.AAC.1